MYLRITYIVTVGKCEITLINNKLYICTHILQTTYKFNYAPSSHQFRSQDMQLHDIHIIKVINKEFKPYAVSSWSSKGK